MLTLKTMEKTKGGMKATYVVSHNNGKTTLEQDFDVVIAEDGSVTGQLHVTELEGQNFDLARERLADWLERLAAGLREPMKVVASVPMFSKDWDEVRRQEEFAFDEKFPDGIQMAKDILNWIEDEKISNFKNTTPEIWSFKHDGYTYMCGFPKQWLSFLEAINATEDLEEICNVDPAKVEGTIVIDTDRLDKFINSRKKENI